MGGTVVGQSALTVIRVEPPVTAASLDVPEMIRLCFTVITVIIVNNRTTVLISLKTEIHRRHYICFDYFLFDFIDSPVRIRLSYPIIYVSHRVCVRMYTLRIDARFVRKRWYFSCRI